MGSCDGVDEVFNAVHMITSLARGLKIFKLSCQKYRFTGNLIKELETPNNLYKHSRLSLLAFLYRQEWPPEKVTHWPYSRYFQIRPTFYKANFVVLNLTGLIRGFECTLLLVVFCEYFGLPLQTLCLSLSVLHFFTFCNT